MSGEKTEKPTSKKLEDARKKGELSQKKSISEVLNLCLIVLFLLSFAKIISADINILADDILNRISIDNNVRINDLVIQSKSVILKSIYIPLGVSIISVLVMLSINRFNFSMQPLILKVNKLNPASGIKNIFSGNSLTNFFKSITIFSILSIILYFVVWNDKEEALLYIYCGYICGSSHFISKIKFILIIFLFITTIIAAVDTYIQYKIFLKKQKMSKDDVKREHKSSEGNPEIKYQRRKIGREIVNSPILKECTHIIYSETHFVALIVNKNNFKIPPYCVLKVSGPKCKKFVRMAEIYEIPTYFNPDDAKIIHKISKMNMKLPYKHPRIIGRLVREAS